MIRFQRARILRVERVANEKWMEAESEFEVSTALSRVSAASYSELSCEALSLSLQYKITAL